MVNNDKDNAGNDEDSNQVLRTFLGQCAGRGLWEAALSAIQPLASALSDHEKRTQPATGHLTVAFKSLQMKRKWDVGLQLLQAWGLRNLNPFALDIVFRGAVKSGAIDPTIEAAIAVLRANKIEDVDHQQIARNKKYVGEAIDLQLHEHKYSKVPRPYGMDDVESAWSGTRRGDVLRDTLLYAACLRSSNEAFTLAKEALDAFPLWILRETRASPDDEWMVENESPRHKLTRQLCEFGVNETTPRLSKGQTTADVAHNDPGKDEAKKPKMKVYWTHNVHPATKKLLDHLSATHFDHPEKLQVLPYAKGPSDLGVRKVVKNTLEQIKNDAPEGVAESVHKAPQMESFTDLNTLLEAVKEKHKNAATCQGEPETRFWYHQALRNAVSLGGPSAVEEILKLMSAAKMEPTIGTAAAIAETAVICTESRPQGKFQRESESEWPMQERSAEQKVKEKQNALAVAMWLLSPKCPMKSVVGPAATKKAVITLTTSGQWEAAVKWFLALPPRHECRMVPPITAVIAKTVSRHVYGEHGYDHRNGMRRGDTWVACLNMLHNSVRYPPPSSQQKQQQQQHGSRRYNNHVPFEVLPADVGYLLAPSAAVLSAAGLSREAVDLLSKHARQFPSQAAKGAITLMSRRRKLPEGLAATCKLIVDAAPQRGL